MGEAHRQHTVHLSQGAVQKMSSSFMLELLDMTHGILLPLIGYGVGENPYLNDGC